MITPVDDEDEDEDDNEEEEEEEDGDDDQDNNGQEYADTIFGRNVVTMSCSCMGGYKSALKWYMIRENQVMNAQLDKYLDTFIAGYKREVATKKSKGIMSIKEGKSPFSFSGYMKRKILFILCISYKLSLISLLYWKDIIVLGYGCGTSLISL